MIRILIFFAQYNAKFSLRYYFSEETGVRPDAAGLPCAQFGWFKYQSQSLAQHGDLLFYWVPATGSEANGPERASFTAGRAHHR